MSIGFMAFFVALLGDFLAWGKRTVLVTLIAGVLLGIASVVYWYITDDLRPFIWVQVAPLLAIPAVLMMIPPRHTRQWLLLAGFGLYGLAKMVEFLDLEVFESLGGMLSGHSLKHLLSGVACYTILLMLQTRQPLSRKRDSADSIGLQ